MSRYVVHDQDGSTEYTKDWIRKHYFPYWEANMIRIGKESEATFENCVDDWVILNYAEKVKKGK